MVFSSAVFLIVFLPITFIVNVFLNNKLSNIWLLLASLFFYAWGEPFFVLLMMASIIMNWLIGILIAKSNNKIRNLVLTIGIIFNLSLLGYYKYAGFAFSILNRLAHHELLTIPQVALPIGISFFTFQAISYIVDVYRKDTEYSSSLINVALYISFFPQLIAGPIVKYRDINKQIMNRKMNWVKMSAGFKRFIYGLSKKVLISNVLGVCVDTIYAYDIPLIDWKMAWIGALAYTFQIYYDFSGYSDMAIGLGKMFGFDILENFNYPYLSKSISEFWRRWHISLGSWFREYLYIPLGGNRKGKIRTYLNLFIVFFLTGLWHGANLTFVFWGLYHGFFSIIERFGFGKWLKKHSVLSTIYCFLVVNFGWVIFISKGVKNSLRYILRMILPFKYPNKGIGIYNYFNMKVFFIGIIAIIGAGLLKKCVSIKIADKWKDSTVEAIYCVFLLILCMASIASNTYNPFIYFQF